MSNSDSLAAAQVSIASNGTRDGPVTQSTSSRADQGNRGRGDGRGRRRRRTPNNHQREAPANSEQGPNGNREGRGRGGSRGRGRGGRGRSGMSGQSENASHNTPGDVVATSGRSSPAHPTVPNSESGAVDNQGGPRRRRMMNSKLTDNADAGSSSNHGRRTDKRREKFDDTIDELRSLKGSAPAADTLADRLIKSLRTPPFADCPICFNSIHPAQPIWSCGPTPGSLSDSSEGDDSEHASDTQCCWTPFHLKCIRAWAAKSLNDLREAYRARGEPGKQGEWRCPGCQRKRLHAPSNYICFCGSTLDPRPARLATPHSCGNSCSRRRACGHSCPLACHPGPCPPCAVTTQLPCYCDRHIVRSFRCADLSNGGVGAEISNLSCGSPCNAMLECGRHRCQRVCHPGKCDACPVIEQVKCYCGKEEKMLGCGIGEVKHSSAMRGEVLEEWDGRFSCEKPCERLFDCGIHKCGKSCHPPSTKPPPCPRSPSTLILCPCGKKLLREIEGGSRSSCSDPIPTCGNVCSKSYENCEHVCAAFCHIGPCAPCSVPVVVPCRCGSTTKSIPCHERTSNIKDGSTEILCDKSCSALRSCGRHQCKRLCCPLAALGMGAKGKNKRRAVEDLSTLGEEAHWHDCDLTCGKMLGCGNHHCEMKDHRGLCPPCLRSSFEELICHCGQTIIDPPVPCGTRINCSFPCSRPELPCGHPKSPHSCHEDPTPCPPCPFLTSKTCACGKTVVNNVRCSQEKVSCGTLCGKSLDCGFHQCQRLCHSGDCGTCTLTCGKPRKLCLPAHHPCTDPCHAPASCSEESPCQANILLHCPCGRLQQPALCGKCNANPAGREGSTSFAKLKCTQDCAIAKRNAKLAEALGISSELQAHVQEGVGRPVVYNEELTNSARLNAKFCEQIEKTFAEFVSSGKKTQVLPYMQEGKRKFVHDLAMVYRMDTQLVDEEPRRSLQLFRRIDTRIPTPLLSSTISSKLNLGKITDQRIGAPSTVRAQPPLRASSPSSQKQQGPGGTLQANRGWTAVVANNAPSRTGSPSSSSSTWRTPQQRPIQRAEGLDSNLGNTGTSATGNSAADAIRLPTQLSHLSLSRTHERGDEAVSGNDRVPESWENDM